MEEVKNTLELPSELEESAKQTVNDGETCIEEQSSMVQQIPTVFSEEEMLKAKETKQERIEAYKEALCMQEQQSFVAKYGYEMSGKQKRQLRRNVERRFKQGKIKLVDFKNFNG